MIYLLVHVVFILDPSQLHLDLSLLIAPGAAIRTRQQGLTVTVHERTLRTVCLDRCDISGPNTPVQQFAPEYQNIRISDYQIIGLSALVSRVRCLWIENQNAAPRAVSHTIIFSPPQKIMHV